MNIRMHQTINGSVDGLRVQLYEAGKEYDLTYCQGARDLASAFIGAGMAEESADATPEPVEVAPVAAAAPAEVAPQAEVAASAEPKNGRKPKRQG